MSLHSRARTSVVWEWTDGSLDRVDILRTGDGWEVSGRHTDTRYVIVLDPEFRCLSLQASSDDATCTLTRTDQGWRDGDGRTVPGSAAAVDLDLSWTAMTNTFPIQRLLADGADTGRFDVVMMSLPDLTPKVVEQSYTRDGRFWQYRNHSNGFATTLRVDKDALVINYPELCRRKDLGG